MWTNDIIPNIHFQNDGLNKLCHLVGEVGIRYTHFLMRILMRLLRRIIT